MARSTPRSPAALLWLLLARASAQASDEACIREGTMYEGHQVIQPPGYVRDAGGCQFQCAITPGCAYFTWRSAPNRSLGLVGPGGCLKFDDQAALAPAPGPAAETVAGPRSCPRSSPGLVPDATANATAPGAASAASPAAPATVPPAPPLPPVLPTGAPAAGPIDGSATAGETGGAVTKGGVSGGQESGGSFPWWAVQILALVAVGVGAVVLVGACTWRIKKKKKMQGKGRRPRLTGKKDGQYDAEAQALMGTEAPPPVAEPAAPQMAAPQLQFQGVQAPAQLGPAAPPQQRAAFGSQGLQQGPFVQAMQMQQMPAVQQPQFR